MEHTQAETLYGTARELIAAASVLFLHDQQRFVPSTNLLMAYASEMLLKSLLAEDCVSEKEWFGHDLQKLFQLASNRELLQFPEGDTFTAMIAIMAPAHKDNSLRYLWPHKNVGVITTVGAALFALNALDAHVRSRVVKGG